MHDDVDLDAGTDQHLISCNQCGTWWQCYGDLQDMWSLFKRFGRGDGGEPATVNIVGCSPQTWPITEDEMQPVV